MKSEEELRHELEKDPDNTFLKICLSEIYLRKRRLTEGRILVEEVLSQDPQNTRALSILGDILFKRRLFKEALNCYREAINKDSRPYLHLQSARALKEMGRFQEALQELQKVLVTDSKNLSFLKERGIILTRMKRFDQALETFQRAREISPKDSFVQKEILRLRSQVKSEDNILKELKTIITMDSKRDDAQLYALLGEKLKETGQVKEATEAYGKASELEPQNIFFIKQKGFCLYRLKRYEEAIECLSRAFHKDPLDYYVRDTLEKCFESKGDMKGFLYLLEEVSSNHPEEKRLWGIIKRIRKRLNLEASKSSDIKDH